MKNIYTETLVIGSLLVCAGIVPAQQLSVSETPIDADKVVAVYPGVAPGSEAWTWKEVVSNPPWGGRGGRLVRNVVQPTLTIFYPPNKARVARTAVVIAPGGGFRWLSIDSEGYEVARALAAQGITALVLKYRLVHTADDEEQFRKEALAFLGGVTQAVTKPGTPPAPLRMTQTPDQLLQANLGREDGLAAVRYVREHAAELGVDTDRIGIVGFSAGGGVANYTATKYEAATRPNFVGQVYAGASPDVQWPQDTPPYFLAIAADDPVIGNGVLSAYETLHAGHHSVELHIFNSGGHGFGMQQRGLTTDLWFVEFSDWLASLGYLSPRQ